MSFIQTYPDGMTEKHKDQMPQNVDFAILSLWDNLTA
jgi:hypothetical protein